MSTEKTFTVVGTSVDPKGVMKIRWTNDLVWRVKAFTKQGHTGINLNETPAPMTKLVSAKWLMDNIDLTDAESEVVAMKIYEKEKELERKMAKETMTKNIETNIVTNAEVDPRVEKFIADTNAENA